MHRCLMVQEILYRVLAELSLARCWASILQLAVTSKAFLEPGLDELWKSHSNLAPLVKCFPSDSWAIREEPTVLYGSPVQYFYFVRALVPEDWTRFIYYARRIRKLWHPWFPRPPTFALDVWEMLAISRPPNLPFLLPNLRELIACEIGGVFSHIRLLLAPTLTHFTLDLTSLDYSKHSLLYLVPSTCPGLSYLEISYPPHDVTSIGNALKRYTSLQTLHLTSINRPILEHVASLPSLKDFSADMSQIAREYLSLEPGAFPGLEKLKLENVGMSAMTNLLRTISSGYIANIWLGLKADNEQSRWASFTQALKRFKQSLRQLNIHESWADYEPTLPELSHIDPAALEHLRELTNLTVLTINSQGLEVTNGLLELLTGAWPEMRELKFLGRDRPLNPATLDGLLPLTLNCPKLVRLDLFIDATNIPSRISSRKFRGRWKPNPNLMLLKPLNSPISNTVQVACFLSKIFPELRLVDPSQSVHAVNKLWGEVMRHLRVVHQLRNDPGSEEDEDEVHS